MAVRALLYGHSQTGGMGIDLSAALQARGWKVKRVVHNGADDGELLALLPAVGDLAGFDRVWLYGGGNSDAPTVASLKKLVQALGAKRTVLILPPINVDRDPAKLAAQTAKNTGNQAGLESLVPVVQNRANASEFSADSIHMRAGSAASKAAAQEAIAAASGSSGAGWALAAIGAAALGYAVWRAGRRKGRTV